MKSPTDDLRGEVERVKSVLCVYCRNDIHIRCHSDLTTVIVALVQEKVAEGRTARGHVANCRCLGEHSEPRCAPPDKQGGDGE